MDQYEQNHAEYIASPGFSAVERKAAAKGFRKAMPSEVRHSANSDWFAADLYCAYGGLWVKTIATDDR